MQVVWGDMQMIFQMTKADRSGALEGAPRPLGSVPRILGAALLALGVGCGLSVAAVLPAHAADTAASAAALDLGDSASRANAADQLQEIIVTATLREETAQTVPVSLTVLGGQELNKLGARSIQDFAALVPGLQLAEAQPGEIVQTIRGVSTGVLSVSATVADYLDNIPITLASAGNAVFTPDPDLFDVQRIEVLKGPQGTLYGASSEGGLIKYVTNPPNLEKFSGAAEAGFEGVPGHGTGNSGHLLVNIPLLKDVLAIRMDAFRVAYPGFIDNAFSGQRNINDGLSEGGRASILWQPVDAFSARLTSYYQRLTSNNPGAEDVQVLSLQPTSGDLRVTTRVPLPLYAKWFINNLTLNYDLPWATLLSSTSLENQHTTFRIDASDIYGSLYGPMLGGNAAVFTSPDDRKKVTEEVRLTSRRGGPLDWLAGFYYTHEHSQASSVFDLYDAVGATDTLVAHNFLTGATDSVLRETAGYGDLTYHLGPSFDLQGGVRYSSVTQSYAQSNYTFFGKQVAPNLTGSATTSKTTYLGTARYHFSPDTMVYARIATGYRPGGANDVIAGFSKAPNSFQPDTVTSYEVGLKGALAEHRFDYSLDVYRVDWKNIQVEGVDSATGFGFFANGGKAHSQGVEFELHYLPLTGLSIGASGAFGDAKLDESIPVPGVTANAGDELPYAPKVSYAATVDYEHPLTAAVKGFAGLTVAGVGARRAYFADQTVGLSIPGTPIHILSTIGELPAYTALDLRTGIIWNRVTLTAYARNVTDERGAASLFASEAGADLVHGTVGPGKLTVIQPRTFGFTVRYDF